MTCVVLLSDGIDSAIAAHLLKAAGHTVLGLHLVKGNPEGDRVGGEGGQALKTSAAAEAEKHARELELDDFLCLDITEEFEAEIIRDFLNGYRRGLTPNPCVRCNRLIKFGRALERAKRLGEDKLSTGHYISCEYSEKYRTHVLRKGADSSKDQSYFLSSIRKEVLPMLTFPLGPLQKREVRVIAQRLGLTFSEKKDSQEICFVPGDSYQKFLAARGIPESPGEIYDHQGKRVGAHTGYQNYTIGQRTKMHFSRALSEKLFIYEIDAGANRLYVGPYDFLMKETATISDTTWYVPLEDREYRCVIRKKAKEELTRVTSLGGDRYRLSFAHEVFAVTPGQTAALYDEEGILIGSGVLV